MAEHTDPSARPASAFQQLLRAVGTGAPAERERAAERLARGGLQVEHTPAVVEAAAAGDQPDRVRVLLLRAAVTALDDALGGPEAVRQTVATKGLVLLYRSDGEVRREAARLLLGLSKRDSQLRAALGELTLAVPDPAGSLDQLTVAATRSREARAALRERAAGGIDLSKHTLVGQLRELADPSSSGTRNEMEEVFARLEGLSFGSIEANREVAALIQAVLDRFERRLACTRCGNPARLRVQATSKDGAFVFDHGRQLQQQKIPGRYHAGTASLPKLEIADTSEAEPS